MASVRVTAPSSAAPDKRLPSIALLHYTGPPIVGGVEVVMYEQARLFAGAGYPTTVVVGRGGRTRFDGGIRIKVIADMDSRPANLGLATWLESTPDAHEFVGARDRLERALGRVLREVDVVVVHNALNLHYNLPLTAAIYRLVERGLIRHLIVWCHDISRYVNPASGAPVRQDYPWSLLREYRPNLTYVTVSAQRQKTLAEIMGCSTDAIQVVPNGVDPALLLGLSESGARRAEGFGLLSSDLIMLMPIRITRAKNIEFGLHVTAALKAAGLRPRLVVTGPPDPHASQMDSYYSELLALRHSLALETEAVFLHEDVTDQEQPLDLLPAAVAELYRLADLVLMPSLREGFGIPVLEAGLVGKPVFATDMPVVGAVGDDLVQLIRPGETPESVAARILSWAEQDSTWRLRRLTRQNYTWPAIFERSIGPLIAGLPAAKQGKAA